MDRDSTVDLKIAGIKSGLQTYQVAWQINHDFDMHLSMNLDWEMTTENNVKSEHLHYFQTFEDVELNWFLVQNKGTASVIFNSKPLFDYLLICEGDDIYGYFERAVEAVMKNDRIDGIFPLNFSIIKKRNNVLQNIKNTRQFIESLHV